MCQPKLLLKTFVALIVVRFLVAMNYQNFEIETNFKENKLIDCLPKILCSIDLKFVSVYYDLKSKSKFIDNALIRTNACGTSLTMIGYQQNEMLELKTSGNHLIVSICTEFEPNLSFLHEKHTENHRFYIIIIFESEPPGKVTDILITLYRKYDILNAVTIVQDVDDKDDLHILTYNPYKDIFIRIPLSNLYKRNELFIEKDLNIFGYHINIVMYKDTITFLKPRNGSKPLNFNYDSFLPQVINSAMNGTLVLNIPYTKDFKIEQIQNADLSINGRSYVASLHKAIGIESTISLKRDDICVLVPYHRSKAMIDDILSTLSTTVWILTVVVIFQATICLYFVSKFQHRTWKHIILFDLFRFYVNQMLPNVPKNVAPRFIITFWLMYCVIINSIFQSALFKGLTNEGRSSQITTIDDLLSTNHQIMMSNLLYNATEYYINNSSLKNHFKVVHFRDYLNLVESNNVQYAYIARARGTNYFANIQMKDGLPVYYSMKQSIVPFMTAYIVRRGCPFLKRINYILRLTDESGLFQYWEQQLSNDYTKAKQHLLFHHPKLGHLENLSFMFKFWSYGVALSTAIFLFELLMVRFKIFLK